MKQLVIVIILSALQGQAFAQNPGDAPSTKTVAPTGRLRLTFHERSPLSGEEDVRQRMDDYASEFGGAGAAVRVFKYDLSEESFDVFVSPNYEPAVPHGLFVWMGNTEISPEWLDVFTKQRLIYVSVIHRNNFPIALGLSLDAAHNLKKQYNIDESRVYVSGFSAGANKAGTMCMRWPEIFSGGVFLMGGWFHDNRKLPNGRYDARMKDDVWKGDLEKIKSDIRLVLVRGEKDDRFTPAQGRGDYESLLLDGFQQVELLVVPGVGHAHPNATWLSKAIDALDRPKTHKPPTTGPTKDPRPQPGQIMMAHQLLSAAQWYLSNPRVEGDPIPYLRRVVDEYPTTPSGKIARELLNKMPTTEPVK